MEYYLTGMEIDNVEIKVIAFVILLGRKSPIPFICTCQVNVAYLVIRLARLFNIKLGGIDIFDLFDLFPELTVEHHQIIDISVTKIK